MAPRNSLSNGKQAEDVKPPMLEHAIQDIYLNTTIESQQAITRLKSLTNELNVFKTDLIKVLGDLKETVKDVVECEGVDGEEEIDEDAPDSVSWQLFFFATSASGSSTCSAGTPTSSKDTELILCFLLS